MGFTASQLGAVIGMATPERCAEAGPYFIQALDIGTETDVVPILLDALLGWAIFLLAGDPTDGQRTHSASLLALVSDHPASTHEMKQKARECLVGLEESQLTYDHLDLDAAVAAVREEVVTLSAISPALKGPSHPEWLEPLTPRETEVLALIEEGLSNREIAERLVLTVGTVKWYASQIYSKLGVQNRSEAVYVARQFDLLS